MIRGEQFLQMCKLALQAINYYTLLNAYKASKNLFN